MVTDAYPPQIGGANRSTQMLAQEMTARGHEVVVASSWQQGLPTVGDDGPVWVHRLRDSTSRLPWISADPYLHIPPPFPDPEAVWRFRRLIGRFRPDVVHAYGWLTYPCAAALLGTGVPMVVSARDYGNVCAVRTLIRNGEEICDGPGVRKCLVCASRFYGPAKGTVAVAGVLGGRPLLRRRTRVVHSISGYVYRVMHRHLVGNRPIEERVIPNFRPEAEAPPADAAILDQLPPEPYILYVGALRRVKGVDLLLAAYRRLTDPPPLVLIGTLAPDSPSAFPAGVTVLRDVPHPTVMAAWDRALFGVAPSLWPEPLGNVVHEGMSRGKAVIGTSPGGHEDMIADGETGLLVPAGEEDALLRAMRRLIAEPETAVAMGRAARERSRLFTAEVVMHQYEEMYQSLAGKPLGRPAGGG